MNTKDDKSNNSTDIDEQSFNALTALEGDGDLVHTQLQSCFDQLIATLHELKESLLNDASNGYRHWVPLTSTEEMANISGIDKAIEHYQALFFVDGQQSNQTRSVHGIIGISKQTAAIAQTVNEAKKSLQSIMAEIRAQSPKSVKPITQRLPERYLAFRQALGNQSLSRLHLKQCYRQLPLLTRRPNRIGFTWSLDGRSITKISIEDAEKRLIKHGPEKPHIQAQLSKLYNLAPKQKTQLRKVQKLAPSVKANIVFKNGDIIQRKTINTPLPILIPAMPYEELPNYTPLPITPPEEHQRLKRLDSKLPDKPFLKSINVFLTQD